MSADIVIELPPREEPAAPDSLQSIGTATVLIRYAGITVLTDPNFLHRGQFAYLGKGLVSRRLTEPAMDVSELPELDVIVLSHLHGDHFDRVAKAGLDHSVPILTTVQAANKLNRWGFRALPLRTWQDATVRRPGSVLRVTALPARHAKGIAQAALPTVMGSLAGFQRRRTTAADVPQRGHLDPRRAAADLSAV
ncbi:MAG: MBL fold metallo-hydrolase [Geodermatophilaceae bacterium]